MLIDTIVTLFVAGFVLIAAYGHILVLQALIAPKGAETPPTLTRVMPLSSRSFRRCWASVMASQPRRAKVWSCYVGTQMVLVCV